MNSSISGIITCKSFYLQYYQIFLCVEISQINVYYVFIVELDTELHREEEHNRYKVILLPRKLVMPYIGTHHAVYLSAKDKGRIWIIFVMKIKVVQFSQYYIFV